MQVMYIATATSQGDGREGRVRTADYRIDLVLAHPKEFGGSGEGSNPEQLFAAGYSACFHSAVRNVARERKVAVTGSSVTAEVGIGRLDDRPGMGLAVTLQVSLPGVPVETAREVVEAAHQLCPYSNATRGNVDVQLVIAESAQ